MSFEQDPLLKSSQQVASEVDAEIELHLQYSTEDLIANGWPPAEARTEAERRFGARAQHRAACRQIQERRRQAAARRSWWSGLTLDLHHGARSLWRSPGYALLAVVTLTLCIGASTLVFSLADGVVFRPLAFEQAERLVVLWESRRENGDHIFVSPANYVDWRERLDSFESIAAWDLRRTTLTGLGEPQRLSLAAVDAGLFETYRVEPLHGRVFTREDVDRNAKVVVVGHELWRSQLGGARDAVGSSIVLEGEPHTVVGVLPPGFREPEGVGLWTPLFFDFDVASSRGAKYLQVVARLADGVRAEQARAELDVLAWALEAEFPEKNTGRGIAAVTLHEELIGSTRRPLLLLLGAVVLVLLLGVANVTALGLARSQARRSEMALRSAIGAGARRIFRQVCVENLLLTLTGALGALLFAVVGLRVLKTSLPIELPRLDQVGIDGRVLAFAVTSAVVTALLMGLWSSAQSRSGSLVPALQGRGHKGGAPRSRFGLVAFELALAVVLLSGAGLLLRSLDAVLAVDPGFESADRLTFRVGLPEAEYAQDSWSPFFEQLEERLAALPLVRSVGMSPWIPFSSGWFFSYQVVGAPEPEPGKSPSAAFRAINSRYFETLGIPLVGGRSFEPRDRAGSLPVAMVNRSFAERSFPDQEAVGQRITVGFRTPEDGPIERTVVGVAEDVDQFGLGSGAAPTIYVPHRQLPFDVMTVVVHTDGEAAAMAPQARAVVAQLDAHLAIEGLETLAQRVSGSLDRRRFSTLLLSAFAGLALVIAAVGVYGLLAQSVAFRRREIGVRIAVGAGREHIARWIVRRIVALAGIGIGLGVLASLGASRLLERMLFEVSPFDPATYFAVAGLLLMLGLAAGAVPAWRAMRVDPVRALRSD